MELSRTIIVIGPPKLSRLSETLYSRAGFLFFSDSAQSPGIVTPYICDWEDVPETASSGWARGYSVCPVYVYFSDLDPCAKSISVGVYLTWTRDIIQPRLIVLFPKVPVPSIHETLR
jgi:hypothetical protein